MGAEYPTFAHIVQQHETERSLEWNRRADERLTQSQLDYERNRKILEDLGFIEEFGNVAKIIRDMQKCSATVAQDPPPSLDESNPRFHQIRGDGSFGLRLDWGGMPQRSADNHYFISIRARDGISIVSGNNKEGVFRRIDFEPDKIDSALVHVALANAYKNPDISGPLIPLQQS